MDHDPTRGAGAAQNAAAIYADLPRQHAVQCEATGVDVHQPGETARARQIEGARASLGEYAVAPQSAAEDRVLSLDHSQVAVTAQFNEAAVAAQPGHLLGAITEVKHAVVDLEIGLRVQL
ncbi:hypothetical protein D3C85_930990 [compost metagenome]